MTQRSLFRQGWKAEEYFGDDVTAHHMNTRSVYTFKADTNICVIHEAKYKSYESSETVDVFSVTIRVLHTPLHSTTSYVAHYDNWLDAYYKAVSIIDSKS